MMGDPLSEELEMKSRPMRQNIVDDLLTSNGIGKKVRVSYKHGQSIDTYDSDKVVHPEDVHAFLKVACLLNKTPIEIGTHLTGREADGVAPSEIKATRWDESLSNDPNRIVPLPTFHFRYLHEKWTVYEFHDSDDMMIIRLER